MTTLAPNTLRWLFTEVKKVIPSAVLSGITGDSAHAARGCFHISRQDQPSGRYCVTPPNDSRGPSDLASAIDINFSDANMKRVTTRLINAIDRKDPRAQHIAEVYGTANGRTVTGRLFGDYATSDDSHLWHVHLAIHRDAVTNPQVVRDVLAIIAGSTTPTTPTEVHDVSFVETIALTTTWKIPADGEFHGFKWANGFFGSGAGKAAYVSYSARFGVQGVLPGDVVQGRIVVGATRQRLAPATVDNESVADGAFVYSIGDEVHKLGKDDTIAVELRVIAVDDKPRTITFDNTTRRAFVVYS